MLICFANRRAKDFKLDMCKMFFQFKLIKTIHKFFLYKIRGKQVSFLKNSSYGLVFEGSFILQEGFLLKNFKLSRELTLSHLTDATCWLISVPSIYDRVHQEIWARNVAIYFRTLDMITTFISYVTGHIAQSLSTYIPSMYYQ